MRKINKIIDYHMKNFITKTTKKVGIDKSNTLSLCVKQYRSFHYYE